MAFTLRTSSFTDAFNDLHRGLWALVSNEPKYTPSMLRYSFIGLTHSEDALRAQGLLHTPKSDAAKAGFDSMTDDAQHAANTRLFVMRLRDACEASFAYYGLEKDRFPLPDYTKFAASPAQAWEEMGAQAKSFGPALAAIELPHVEVPLGRQLTGVPSFNVNAHGDGKETTPCYLYDAHEHDEMPLKDVPLKTWTSDYQVCIKFLEVNVDWDDTSNQKHIYSVPLVAQTYTTASNGTNETSDHLAGTPSRFSLRGPAGYKETKCAHFTRLSPSEESLATGMASL